MIASPLESLKQQKRALIRGHAQATDGEGSWETIVTLVPLAVLWGIAIWGVHISWWIAAAATVGLTFVHLRVFSLMHECGHGSLFKTQKLNRALGFVFGVISGMPQYVWSRNHHYHHQTNGNWDRYRGPLSTLSIDEYAQLSPAGQRAYRLTRHLLAAPLGGFIYLIFNPRVNWLKGSAGLVVHALKRKLAEPHLSFRAHAATFESRYWKSAKEYRHQTANNLVLLSIWALMCWAIGPGPFFGIYLTSVSIAGAAGIVLFTVQHNFDHAHASQEDDWDLDHGALTGTSYLVFPGWLNWVTANIGYHHIHHLSAAIPCYRLPGCHAEYQGLFEGVTRITLTEIPRHLKCILWDSSAQRITSISAYHAGTATDVAAECPSG